MDLKENQSAIILETDDHGEFSIQIASPDEEGLSGIALYAIAKKLSEDEGFQSELMDIVEGEG